jgi:hypothetical protein
MFELNQDFKVSPSKVILLEADGRALRRVRFKLERDFDEDLAEAIGNTGTKALEAVSDRTLTKAVATIDAVHGEMVLKAGEEVITIPAADGFKLTAAAGKIPKNPDADEGPPTLKLEFDAGMAEDLWAFLGRHAGDFVRVTYHNRQLSLPLEEKGGSGKPQPPEEKPKAKRGRKARAAAPTLVGDHDAQDAATPEEAESARDQRLREERAERDGAWADGGTNGRLAF